MSNQLTKCTFQVNIPPLLGSWVWKDDSKKGWSLSGARSLMRSRLLYPSCFFEQKSLENKPLPLDVVPDDGRETLAKKEAQKKLAVGFFRLMMDLERDQQHKLSQRCPPLSSMVSQRSPLMVSLLPSPKERSPHLFLGSRARSQIPPEAEYCDTKALTEQLDQQVARASFGILGKPMTQFSPSTLLPYGGQKNRDEGEDEEAGSDVNDSADHPAIHVRGSKKTRRRMRS